jgi:hypothetical protein
MFPDPKPHSLCRKLANKLSLAVSYTRGLNSGLQVSIFDYVLTNWTQPAKPNQQVYANDAI